MLESVQHACSLTAKVAYSVPATESARDISFKQNQWGLMCLFIPGIFPGRVRSAFSTGADLFLPRPLHVMCVVTAGRYKERLRAVEMVLI